MSKPKNKRRIIYLHRLRYSIGIITRTFHDTRIAINSIRRSGELTGEQEHRHTQVQTLHAVHCSESLLFTAAPTEWVSDWLTDWLTDWVSECTSEWVSVRVSEWVSEYSPTEFTQILCQILPLGTHRTPILPILVTKKFSLHSVGYELICCFRFLGQTIGTLGSRRPAPEVTISYRNF